MSGFPLHEAIAQKIPPVEIGALLQKNPELIYQISKDGQTVFDAVCKTDDIEVILHVLRYTMKIFWHEERDSQQKRWMDLKVANGIQACLNRARKIILSKDEPSEELRGKLFAFCQYFIAFYFLHFEIQEAVLSAQSAAEAEEKSGSKEESRHSLRVVILGICQDAAVLFSQNMMPFSIISKKGTREQKNSSDVDIAQICLKLFYPKLLDFDAEKHDKRQQFLGEFLQSPFYQNLLIKASEDDLVTAFKNLAGVPRIDSQDEKLTLAVVFGKVLRDVVKYRDSRDNNRDKLSMGLLTFFIKLQEAILPIRLPLDKQKADVAFQKRKMLLAEFYIRRGELYEKMRDNAHAQKDYEMAASILKKIALRHMAKAEDALSLHKQRMDMVNETDKQIKTQQQVKTDQQEEQLQQLKKEASQCMAIAIRHRWLTIDLTKQILASSCLPLLSAKDIIQHFNNWFAWANLCFEKDWSTNSAEAVQAYAVMIGEMIAELVKVVDDINHKNAHLYLGVEQDKNLIQEGVLENYLADYYSKFYTVLQKSNQHERAVQALRSCIQYRQQAISKLEKMLANPAASYHKDIYEQKEQTLQGFVEERKQKLLGYCLELKKAFDLLGSITSKKEVKQDKSQQAQLISHSWMQPQGAIQQAIAVTHKRKRDDEKSEEEDEERVEPIECSPPRLPLPRMTQ